MQGRTEPFQFTILGEPASKSNGRRKVTIKGKMAIIKSKKAIDYSRMFLNQCPTLSPIFQDHVTVEMTIYYASFRPDLDESLILDLMQDRIYRNDRQVKRKVIQHGLDRDEPRAEIRVSPFTYE